VTCIFEDLHSRICNHPFRQSLLRAFWPEGQK
jgi:hypothetical protein